MFGDNAVIKWCRKEPWRLFSAVILALLGWLVFVPSGQDYLQILDQKLVASFLRASVDDNWRPEVSTLISYDNISLRERGFPIPRNLYAETIERLNETSNEGITLDIIFGESNDFIGTVRLAEALQKSKSVTLPMILSSNWVPPLPLWADFLPQNLNRSILNEKMAFETSWPPIISQSAYAGLTDIEVDNDGYVSWYPVVSKIEGEWIPSLAFATYLSREKAHFEVKLSGEAVIGVQIITAESRSIIDLQADPKKKGRILLRPRISSINFPEIPLTSFLRDTSSNIKNTNVFVATTADGVRGYQATAVDSLQTPIHTHIFAFEDLASGQVVKSFPFLRWLCISIGGLLILLSLVLKPVNLYITLGLIAALSAVGILCAAALWASGFYPEVSILFSCIVAAGSIEVARRFDIELLRKRALQKSFSKYLHPSLVKKIGESESSIELGGEFKDITIFFCDLRNFTALSESVSTQDLVAFMNDYFELVITEIQRTNGTVDKFIGDAVMAFWNAPLDVENHVAAAFNSCISLETQFRNFVNRKKSENINWDIGMAIHTGRAVVGNIGGKERFNYTALGDNVNLASRLEGLTKVYGVRILISGESAVSLGEERCVLLDVVKVKGRENSTQIYIPKIYMEDKSEEWLVFLSNYKNGNWDESLSILSRCEKLPWHKLFFDRVTEMKSQPIEKWDGIWKFESK